MADDEYVSIPKTQYVRLLAAEDFLDCLRAAGVDNWDGYAEAQLMQELDRG